MKVDFKIFDPDTNDTGGLYKGFVIFTIEAYVNEKKVGYIKVSLLSKENFQRACPTPWHFLSKWDGKGKLDLDNLDNPIFVFDNLAGYMDTPWSYESLNLPNEEKIDKLAKYEQRVLRKIDEQTDKLIDSPYVDYISVDEDCRRKGIGTLLYLEAAKLIQSKGYVFRSSRIQSGEAMATWESLERQGLAQKSGNYYIFTKDLKY